MDTVKKLVAIEEIKLLKARYFRFVDTKDWDELRRLFTDDAVLEFPESLDEACTIDDFINFLPSYMAGATSIHHGHMPEIAIHSAHSASAIWAMSDQIHFSQRENTDVVYLRGYGHYHETYEHRGEYWLIRTLQLSRLRLEKDLVLRAQA